MWVSIIRAAPAALFLVLGLLPAAGRASSFDKLAADAEKAQDSGRLEEAVALYRKALALRPDWAKGWWSLGTSLYDRDDYAGAAVALQKAVALRPSAGIAFVMLGLSEAKIGRRKDALRHIEQGRKLSMGDDSEVRTVALFTEATLLLESGEFNKAQDALDVLAREGTAQSELMDALGMAVLGIEPAAFKTADAATRKLVWQAGWAEHYAALRDFRNALREYRSLVKIAPNFHNVQFAFGRFLLANHQDNEAVEAFRREIENTPQHLLARLGIAGIKMTGDPAGGLPYARQAVQLAPKLAESRFLLGATLLGLDRLQPAIAELEAARGLDPHDPRIYFQLSRAYRQAGRNRDAQRANAAFVRLSSSPGSR